MTSPPPEQIEHPALAMLARETQVRRGPVPAALDGEAVGIGQRLLRGTAFLLRTTDGVSFLYRQGEGITIERAPGSTEGAEALWRNGSVYAAIASINGLLPVHASAVAHDGRVFAFTGPSGAGKSTLIAGLGAAGLPMFCDDTLVLDLSDPARVLCLPGHKRLKLTAEAAALTGAAPQEPVGAGIAKTFAAPPAGDARGVLPLAELIFLETGDGPALAPLTGAERFARLADDHYTAELYAEAQQQTRAAQFAQRARLASQIAMARFVRPRDITCFAAGIALVADHVRGY